MTNHTTTARELFKAAYESRYTWDRNFPGYSADVKLMQGAEVYTGSISINRDLSAEVSGIAEPQVSEGIYTQLKDIITHRQHVVFDQSYGQHEFAFGETDQSGAVEILVKDDSMASVYKIQSQQISQVRRVMGKTEFIIDTHEVLETGSGYIDTRYDAIFSNAQINEVTSVLKFNDSYAKFGNYHLLIKQVIQEDDGTITEFDYFNIKLLQPVGI